MRLFVAVFVAFLIGCAGPEYVDIDEYIAVYCSGESAHEFAVDRSFDLDDLTVIVDAFDEFVASTGADAQICAALEPPEFALWEGGVIQYGESDEVPWRTGYYSGTDIFLYTDGPVWSDAHLRKVALHELGHFFGAGHSDDSDDVMKQGWWGVAHYSAADILKIVAGF